MSQTLEAIKGGGGSIKVGTTGTINALMSRELQSVKVASSPKTGSEANDVTPGITPNKKVPTDETSTSSRSKIGNTMKEKHISASQKAKHHHVRQDSRNAFLRSDSVSIDGNGTSNRKKNEKKASCIVEIVDIKCGVHDKIWANPITSKLKRLTFSKLSEPNGVK